MKRLKFWHWSLIALLSAIALDLIVSRFLPYEIWLTWFCIKAFLIFIGLPIASIVGLFFLQRFHSS